ncbi:hypothetical protein [Cupriavidus nantongensis]|uniref:Uncharacterized protein n=1 Tax=Cupriavidus nantongensis TaxID=1796606 RepID=A0A142JNG6_9BURK|nr:hypothetical protein [Cupriavidus nantongensis]AMR79628.1 hypothetical protein A2G96_18790 [Cupriavidus nantongensis]
MNKHIISGANTEAFMIHPVLFPKGFGISSFAGGVPDCPDAIASDITRNVVIRVNGGPVERRGLGSVRVSLLLNRVSRREDLTNLLAVFNTHMPMPPRAGSDGRVSLYVRYEDGRVLELADGAFLIENGGEPVNDTRHIRLNMQFTDARLHPTDALYTALTAKPHDPDAQYYADVAALAQCMSLARAKELAEEVRLFDSRVNRRANTVRFR